MRSAEATGARTDWTTITTKGGGMREAGDGRNELVYRNPWDGPDLFSHGINRTNGTLEKALARSLTGQGRGRGPGALTLEWRHSSRRSIKPGGAPLRCGQRRPFESSLTYGKLGCIRRGQSSVVQRRPIAKHLGLLSTPIGP